MPPTANTSPAQAISKSRPMSTPPAFHPFASVFPLLEGDDFDSLVADIKTSGLIEPIVLFEGQILDGRNRYQACLKAGVEPHFTTYKGDDPCAFIITKNIRRRHLTSEQKRQLLAKLIKNDPDISDRQIAKMAGVDNKTVASIRTEIERREEIPHVGTRTDSKGREQPARKTKRKAKAAPKSKRRPLVARLDSSNWLEWSPQEQQRWVEGVGIRNLFAACRPETKQAFLAGSKAKFHSPGERWREACAQALEAFEVLIDLQGEYQDWLDKIPDKLKSSTAGGKLQAAANLALEDAKRTVQEAENINLPQGFGRDQAQ
jgi:ParB-like nuclease domain